LAEADTGMRTGERLAAIRAERTRRFIGPYKA
jgi:hypothetical protein